MRKPHNNNHTNNVTKWNFKPFLQQVTEPSIRVPKLTSFVVNYKIPACIVPLWKHSHPRICCDGGLNNLHHSQPELFQTDPPTHVVGDMDSLSEHLKPTIEKLKISIHDDPDQNSNDLEKGFRFYVEHYKKQLNHPVCVFGGVGGNLSQVFANIHALFLFPQLQIYLVGDENISVLLRKGQNEIEVVEGLPCSVVPLNSPVIANSSQGGLAYPLQNLQLKYGDIISTSNVCAQDNFTIDVTEPCLFTLDLKSE